MGSRYDRIPDGDHETEWVEFAEAAERAGVTEAVLAQALADGDLSYSTRLPGHEGVPMMRLVDVRGLIPTQPPNG
jgi:hypothetical protein